MQRCLSIFLLFIFISANTAFGEILRLPTLLHHYSEHVKWDHNDSFSKFIAEHYVLKINHPDDQHNDHQNIPFKSLSATVFHVLIIPEHLTIIEVDLIAEQNNSPVIQYAQSYFRSFANGIWQPPRTH